MYLSRDITSWQTTFSFSSLFRIIFQIPLKKERKMPVIFSLLNIYIISSILTLQDGFSE